MDATWKVLDLTHTQSVGWFRFQQVYQKYQQNLQIDSIKMKWNELKLSNVKNVGFESDYTV